MFLDEAINEAKSTGKANNVNPNEISEAVKKIRARSSTRKPKD